MSRRNGWFFMVVVAALLVTAAGCKDRKQGLTLHFVFEDAKGITVGKKVMGDGVFVGQVIAPPQSPKPKYVVVSVCVDGLSPEKMPYLTTNLTAEIRKDSLVAGEVYLDLIFPEKPGQPVADGTTLRGRGGVGSLAGLSGIPHDPSQFMEMLRTAFIAVDPVTAGSAVFYLNWISLVVAALVVVALILDFLIRLPQGSERERSSPRLLRDVWMLFCVVLVARVFVGVVRALGGLGVLGEGFLNALRIGPADVMGLLAQEWPFWALAIVLITIRFKFDLLMRAGKG